MVNNAKEHFLEIADIFLNGGNVGLCVGERDLTICFLYVNGTNKPPKHWLLCTEVILESFIILPKSQASVMCENHFVLNVCACWPLWKYCLAFSQSFFMPTRMKGVECSIYLVCQESDSKLIYTRRQAYDKRWECKTKDVLGRRRKETKDHHGENKWCVLGGFPPPLFLEG